MTQVKITPEIQNALAEGRPVVSLESTVISHGLPWPHNLALAEEMEALIRAEGAIPATMALIEGVPCVGLDQSQLELLAGGQVPVRKLSRRDLGSAIAHRETGATTVAATMLFAHWAGIRVFATGGVGGVHRGDAGDVSADLVELSQTPVAVVCAGAKAILDLPRTLEWLETFGVPVVGYQTDDLPAFYTRTSGIALVERADSPSQVAGLLRAHWGMGLNNGVLITNPIPAEDEIPADEINNHIEVAIQEADIQGIRGKDITPFLLSRLGELTAGRSLAANLALLKNNGRLAAQIALALATES